MSFLDQFSARAPMINTGNGGLGGGSFFGGNSAQITPQNALRLTTVFSCNRVIAETLSSISLDVFRNIENGKEKAKDFSLYRLLKLQPNPNITSVMFREMIAQDLNLKGNHYSQIIRNGLGEVDAIYPLVSDKMEVKLTTAGKRYIYDTGSKKVAVPPYEILHIPGLPSDDGVTGLSPIEYNKRSIQLGSTAQEFGINFFENGANGSGEFEKEGSLSDEAFERLKNELGKNYTGLKNSSKPMLLEDGLKYNRMSITNNEAQFLETRKYQKEDIASIFRVPMHMINSLENATFSNIEHQSLEFVQFTMLPWIKRIEQAFTISLLTLDEQDEYSIKFNVDTLLRGDFKTRTEGYRTLSQIGALTINDILEFENLNTIGEEGNARFIELNRATIQQIMRGEFNNANTKN